MFSFPGLFTAPFWERRTQEALNGAAGLPRAFGRTCLLCQRGVTKQEPRTPRSMRHTRREFAPLSSRAQCSHNEPSERDLQLVLPAELGGDSRARGQRERAVERVRARREVRYVTRRATCRHHAINAVERVRGRRVVRASRAHDLRFCTALGTSMPRGARSWPVGRWWCHRSACFETRWWCLS